MLLVDETRRRSTFVPLGFLAIGLSFALVTVAIAWTPNRDLGALGLVAGLAILMLAWFVLGVRRTARDGDTIEVRAASGRSRLPAQGCQVALLRGGGTRSPHYDVILQPSHGAALRLARLELGGIGRAPAMARKIAAALGVRVDERSVGELEALFAHAAEQRRHGLRLFAGLLGVSVVVSIVFQLVTAGTMATLEVRCPGGKVTQGSATMLDGLRMTTNPGSQTFELHPASGPAFVQRVELVADQTTVLDCSAHPEPARQDHVRVRQ